jgi:hypothetical protein
MTPATSAVSTVAQALGHHAGEALNLGRRAESLYADGGACFRRAMRILGQRG